MGRSIIWDWNGTLLDDVQYTYSIVNEMLVKRGKPALSYEQYKNVFSFPIREYYKKIGFEFKNDEEYYSIVEEFNCLYERNIQICKLQQDAISVMSFFQVQGYSQFLLSGLNHKDLIKAVNRFKIAKYFEEIVGSKSSDANDKVLNCKKMFRRNKIKHEDAIFIGDTTADYDLAAVMGCRCILTSNGHQTRSILGVKETRIIKELKELKQ